MRVISVGASYKKMVSDGNYGHESAEVSLSAEIDDQEDAEAAGTALFEVARDLVFDRLGDSNSLTVRRALKHETRTCYECDQPMEDDTPGSMHAACREARDARWAKEREEQYRAEQPRGEEDLEDLPL